MNTDFIIWDQIPREKQYIKNITSKGDTRYYDDSCSTINQYAREQNTVYDPLTNQMLYGINTNMHVLGVSDGTCNQINPYIFQQNNICGSGAAGGNRCTPDAYGIENNKEILKKSVIPGYCTYGDMYDLSAIKNSSFDVIFCNCLMCAWPSSVLDILREFNRIANKAVYLCCPFIESSLGLFDDPYRVFLAKKSWWHKQFKEANFERVTDCIYTIP